MAKNMYKSIVNVRDVQHGGDIIPAGTPFAAEDCYTKEALKAKIDNGIITKVSKASDKMEEAENNG